jgi:hypothetical protein
LCIINILCGPGKLCRLFCRSAKRFTLFFGSFVCDW